MVDLLVLVAALSVAPSPHPSTAPTVLKEIGHVRATTVCAQLATHANHAIGVALRNDTMIADTISRMRNVDLDSNPIKRRNALQALGDLARDINLQALAADGSIKLLRKLAANSTDETQKKELTAFANSLGGAIWRQRKIARDLNGFLAKMDAEDMLTVDDSQSKMNASTEDPPTLDQLNAPGTQTTRLSRTPAIYNNQLQRVPGGVRRLGEDVGNDNQKAQMAASYYQQQLPDIVNDEGTAADRVVGATTGC